MATCMYCGTEVSEGLSFCTNCGAALPVEAPAATQPQTMGGQSAYQDPSYQQTGYQQQTDYQQTGYQQPGYQQPQMNYGAPAPTVNDSGSIGWGVLGFFFPIVGLVLFLVWKNTKPNTAKVAGMGGIIGFVVGLIMNFSMLAGGM